VSMVAMLMVFAVALWAR